MNTPTPNEIEQLQNTFKRAAEILAHGNGPWKPPTPNARKAMKTAVEAFAAFAAKYPR